MVEGYIKYIPHCQNPQISYMIGGSTPAGDPNSPTFLINNETGVVTVASALNFETTPQYTLTVVARDNAPPASRRSATVSVR